MYSGNIDTINDSILALLAKRTAYVQRAGDVKLEKGVKTSLAPERVAAQIKALSEKSDTLQIPRYISVEAFKQIINGSIQFEQQYMDKKQTSTKQPTSNRVQLRKKG